MLTIDGSMLEGGGQLTRLTLSLAAITSQSVRIHSIRAGRSALRSRTIQSTSTPHSTSRRDKEKPRGDRDRDRGKGKGRSTRDSHPGPITRNAAGGLKDSHLAALEFLADLCGARVTGNEVGSTNVTFRPSVGGRTGGGLRLDVGPSGREFEIALEKSGSVWLIFQAVFPCLLFGARWGGNGNGDDRSLKEPHRSTDNRELPSGVVTLTLKGGTNVPSAMSTEYMQQVFLPTITRLGLPEISIETISRGWAGTAPAIGEVKIQIHAPTTTDQVNADGRFTLGPFSLHDCGSLTQIDITILADPISTRQTILDTLTATLSTTFPSTPLQIIINDPSSDDRRQYILLVARTSTGSRLGSDFLGGGGRAKTVEQARRKIEEACLAVVDGLKREVERGGAVDRYLQDQLVGVQALAGGRSRVCGVGGQKGMGGDGVVEDEDEDEDENGNEVDQEKVQEVGDETGTLHTRTVRWVCGMMLKDWGVRFESGGVCHGIGWNGVDCKRIGPDDRRMENLHIDDEE